MTTREIKNLLEDKYELYTELRDKADWTADIEKYQSKIDLLEEIFEEIEEWWKFYVFSLMKKQKII